MVIGSHTDLAAFAPCCGRRRRADLTTSTSQLLEKLVADGVNVAPSPQALVQCPDNSPCGSVWPQQASPLAASIKDPDE